MTRSFHRLPFWRAAVLIAGLGSCSAAPGDAPTAPRAAGLGTYRLSSPYPALAAWRPVPFPLALPTDQARYPVGSTTRAAAYDGPDDDGYLRRETAQVGCQRVGVDPRRQTAAVGPTTDDERQP